MSVKVIFKCSGCDAIADGTDTIKKQFVSFSGKGHGFGRYILYPPIEEIVPEGWVAFDPYTLTTYCKKCWDDINLNIKKDTGK